mgnify:CR=1 FL=1
MTLGRVLPSGKQSELDIGWQGGYLREYKLEMRNLFQIILTGLAVLGFKQMRLWSKKLSPQK